MTISFNEWLETKVTDAKHILPEAKIAFMQMYLKDKENGTLSENNNEFPDEFEKWLKDKVKDTKNILPEAKKAFFNLYEAERKENEKNTQPQSEQDKKSSKEKQVPNDLNKLQTNQFLDKNGKIDIDFALRVAQKAAAQSRR